MNNAVIAQIGTPRELYDAPASEFVADFIGEANLLNGEITEISGNIANVAIGNITIVITSENQSTGPVRLAIRPNRVKILPGNTPNTIPGLISKAVYVGSHMEYIVESELGELFVIADVDSQFQIGTDIGIGFADPGPVMLPR